MNCREINRYLFSYAEGQLSDEESIAVEKHLEACSECKGIVDEIRLFLAFVDEDKRVEENPFFFTRVESRLLKPVAGRSLAPSRLIPAFAALLFFIGGILAGVNIGKLYGTGDDGNDMIVNVTRPFLDELSQEPLESWFIDIYSEGDDKR
ncbi:MAG: zf-HC2 domain-containing protein [Bacteroidales bacterium]|jgi:predicted anti-sigma-YlaC factor YlaD|nr:zf-HC2 domain-containing protein [Bacteroidales bacterium]